MENATTYSNVFLLKKALVFAGIITMLFAAISIMDFANILSFLQSAGVNVPPGLSEALSTIGTVYGIQHYIIGLLGVTVPAALIGAALAAGTFGL